MKKLKLKIALAEKLFDLATEKEDSSRSYSGSRRTDCRDIGSVNLSQADRLYGISEETTWPAAGGRREKLSPSASILKGCEDDYPAADLWPSFIPVSWIWWCVYPDGRKKMVVSLLQNTSLKFSESAPFSD